MTNFSANDEFFLPSTFLPTIIFTDKYFYRHIFTKKEQLVFSNLKIPLVYLFNFKFDLTFKT